ncbi:hypothetical protein HCD_01240 [Helicobacter cetorum MIT 99-5656]|uniref:Outer membrane protein n=1 Tax=Helicobacter cetorum (strain ATCC BAA-540 / CCUG 52418 / MIT 99-5656) TaxID=1163745 RepID=I0EQR1_HELCM|nr:hypothetical protein [Helicobacter cetorum]AFI05280.1 hypothetical protein HCD_01240 [Helicobacter cetorum MIT 99-5656]
MCAKNHFFKPLEPTKKYFGSFKIGYLYQHMQTTKKSPIRPKNRPPILINKKYHDAILALEAGKIVKDKFLLGGYLDGAMGRSYFMSAGFMAGVRLFRGWVVPKISLGYQLQILGAKIDKYQFNIQSAVGSIGIFFNVAKNFGLSVEARGGIPFYFIESKFSKAFGTPRLNIYSIGITFTFYDFTKFLG